MTLIIILAILLCIDFLLYAVLWPKYSSEYGQISYFPGAGFFMAYRIVKDDDESWWDL